MLTFITKWFHRRNRALDLRILWPRIKSQSPDLPTARNAFFQHITTDPSWTCEYTEAALGQLVEGLN